VTFQTSQISQGVPLDIEQSAKERNSIKIQKLMKRNKQYNSMQELKLPLGVLA
jgi:hypothetical protein